jgi:hypothetical protein
LLGGGAVVLCAASVAAQSQSYIGAERCHSCHEFEYRVWAASPHAKAHVNLSAEQLRDPKCNVCHTMLPNEPDERFVGVQCERCHGGGRYYHRRYVMRDRELARLVGLVTPKEEHCRQCHTEGTPSIAPFDMAEMWKRIDHGRAAREAWAKGRAVSTRVEAGAAQRGE